MEKEKIPDTAILSVYDHSENKIETKHSYEFENKEKMNIWENKYSVYCTCRGEHDKESVKCCIRKTKDKYIFSCNPNTKKNHTSLCPLSITPEEKLKQSKYNDRCHLDEDADGNPVLFMRVSSYLNQVGKSKKSEKPLVSRSKKKSYVVNGQCSLYSILSHALLFTTNRWKFKTQEIDLDTEEGRIVFMKNFHQVIMNTQTNKNKGKMSEALEAQGLSVVHGFLKELSEEQIVHESIKNKNGQHIITSTKRKITPKFNERLKKKFSNTYNGAVLENEIGSGYLYFFGVRKKYQNRSKMLEWYQLEDGMIVRLSRGGIWCESKNEEMYYNLIWKVLHHHNKKYPDIFFYKPDFSDVKDIYEGDFRPDGILTHRECPEKKIFLEVFGRKEEVYLERKKKKEECADKNKNMFGFVSWNATKEKFDEKALLDSLNDEVERLWKIRL